MEYSEKKIDSYHVIIIADESGSMGSNWKTV